MKLISKLIEKAVASKLTDYLSFNSLHESFQSTYKRYHNSETALLRVHNDILRSIDNGGGVTLVLLDLSADFDTVNHELLLSRLPTWYGMVWYGLCGSVLNWFTSYLTNCIQFVDINGSFSMIRHLGVGVPQGSVLGPLLYLLYTSPVADIFRPHNLNFHFYADDSQLFLSLKGADRLSDFKLQLEACINDICCWMAFNELKLNPDKTELLVIHSSYCSCPSLSCLCVGDVDVAPVKAASNLGIVFNNTMSFKSHISDVGRSSFYHLRNISRIRKYLTHETTEMVVHSFFTFKLDYRNSLLYGFPKFLIAKLQSVQNSSARLVGMTRKFDHITPTLIDLHWLSIRHCIVFKILLLVYKSLNYKAPSYLSDLLTYRMNSYSLRSISNGDLVEPSSKMHSYGDRPFAVCAPRLWNSLPLPIRRSSSVDILKNVWKTYLFKKFVSECR